MSKKINISACKEHSFWMPNKLELSVGFHGENYMSRCSGCANRGFIWDANSSRHTFLTITNFYNKDEYITSYCVHCSAETLHRLLQDLTNKMVASCPCSLCSFDNLTNPQKPRGLIQDLMNSPEPITICFCALPHFNILGKLQQDINQYRKDESIRNYKNLATENIISKDIVCDNCKKTAIDYNYHQVKLENGVVANLCGVCKREAGGIVVDKIW